MFAIISLVQFGTLFLRVVTLRYIYKKVIVIKLLAYVVSSFNIFIFSYHYFLIREGKWMCRRNTHSFFFLYFCFCFLFFRLRLCVSYFVVVVVTVVVLLLLGSLRIEDFRTTAPLGHLIVPRRRPVEI